VKVALIATGDEVVSGQILNSNASYLASTLSSIGVEVVGHFAVLDREESLKEVLEFLAKKNEVDVVLTIGGLGPTRDDLTRQVLAEYSKQDLIIDQKLWSDMKCSLITRSIKPRMGHKWQCYFPEDCQIFKNAKGTAQSFMVESKKFKIVAIPGPPNEVESVLNDGGLLDWFRDKTMSNLKLMSWQCINIPESELAHEVEKALHDCPFQIGYRASPPITEVKLWVDKGNKDFEKWIKKMDEVCKESLYSKNGFSYVDEVLKTIFPISFLDHVTRGQALDEIKKVTSKEVLKDFSYAYGKDFSSQEAMLFSQNGEDFKLSFKDKSVDYSLKGQRLFRSKRSNIYALLMLFKNYYLEYID
jgi:molybdenum cofactor synthesis domain-containing protein